MDRLERVEARLERLLTALAGSEREARETATLAALGMTREQALEAAVQVAPFREDWDAPGGEVYNDL